MFDVGDLVVCVDDTNSRPLQRHNLKRGAYYRVTGRGVATFSGLPAITIGFPRNPRFHISRFRKIDAPDTEVSRLIRACKPAREGQPA